MEHELARGAFGVDSRWNDAHRRDSPALTAASLMLLDAFPPGPTPRACKGSGNPGGGRSYQGLGASCRAPSSRWQRTSRFFGGSGSGPSRGAFPFSSAENRRIGAIGVRWSKGEEEEERE